MSDFIHACIDEATKYGVYDSPIARRRLKFKSPPAAMTILDSEGYITSRADRRDSDNPVRQNLRSILSTVFSGVDADVPPIPESSKFSDMSESGHDLRGSAISDIQPVPEIRDVDLRIQSLCEQLSQRDAECNELRELESQAQRQLMRLKRNHKCEFRVLQKASRIQDPRSKFNELTDRFAKVVLERDSLVCERAQLVSENMFMKQGLNALMTDRNRIASDYNRVTKLGLAHGHGLTAADHQVIVFSSHRPLARLGVTCTESVVAVGPDRTEQSATVDLSESATN